MSLYEIKHNKGTMAMRMGVVIDNESIDKKSVWFLGAKAQRVKGVSVYNMFGETFMGDNSMSTLQNWLLSVGSVEICVIRLSSQDLRKNIGHTLLIKDYPLLKKLPVEKCNLADYKVRQVFLNLIH